jgi:DNA segregation ATPase FtsK/SpoIIIE, S-DNA-T family
VTLELRRQGAIEVRPPLRDRARAHLVGVRVTAVAVSRRHAWTVWQVVRQLPATALLLVAYTPRGLARVSAAWARYLRDNDTAELRHHHAGTRETKEFKVAADERRATLTARWMINGSVAGVVLALLFAWTWPRGFGVVSAALVFVWVVKLIPGRSMGEVLFAFGLAVGVYFGAPHVADRVPVPPGWAFWVAGMASVVGLGWAGRPLAKPLVTIPLDGDAIPQKPSKEMVVDALCRIGIPGMTVANAERVHEETIVKAPGVATTQHGYVMEMELPPGVTAAMVVGKRAELAGALRRDLGCIWPSGNEERHPGYLRLFFSHKPMNKARQPAWPLMNARPVDIFEPLPLFTDEELRWVSLTIAGTHTAVGGASGFGKSVWLRQLSCAIALDLRVRLVIFDGKRSGDFDHVRKLAHAFHEGAEDHEVAAQLAELRGLIDECLRRAKFLKGLPPEERSPKVTSALASKYPKHLSPIVLIYDEVQEGTEYGVKGVKEDMQIRREYAGLLTRLARIARSAGIFMVLSSQKPDTGVIPSSIMGNCSIRAAFKVSEQVHNDQILGTSARKNGIDATMFGSRDRGMAWLKGGDAVDAQVVRSWSEMVDVNVGIELADKAYELRRAAGLLTGEAGDDVEDAVVVLDIRADVERVMADHMRQTAHLADLVEWLRNFRPDYATLQVAELGQRLRSAGVTVGQVKVNGRNTKGVDLRKQVAADTPPDGYPEDE